ncbi:MAG: hypothetical protein K2L03_04170, partial [Bacteroidales bacterium]|nr:hypothetical protein [Bacteroidales bacterium]
SQQFALIFSPPLSGTPDFLRERGGEMKPLQIVTVWNSTRRTSRCTGRMENVLKNAQNFR